MGRKIIIKGQCQFAKMWVECHSVHAMFYFPSLLLSRKLLPTTIVTNFEAFTHTKQPSCILYTANPTAMSTDLGSSYFYTNYVYKKEKKKTIY